MMDIAYVIVVLGCGHAMENCAPLETTAKLWQDQAACERAVPSELESRAVGDYPVLIAKCEGRTITASGPRSTRADKG